jgi:threonine/homoserine efflux transporter RhtA
MTVAEPVVASLLGIIVLGETLNTSRFGYLLLAVAAGVMVVATAALARGSVAAEEPRAAALV